MLVECNYCNAMVKGEIVSSYESIEPDDWVQNTLYTLYKCPQCQSPILASQEYEYNGVELDWGVAQKIFPNNTFHINPVIPDKLKRALVECIQCYKAKSYTATAIMCRRAIEGFCAIRGVKGKDLANSIKKLKEDGVINEQLYEWANQLRHVGNEAAHDIDSDFSPLDAKDILDFTIAILDFTYSFKDKFDKFKERREERKKIATTTPSKS